MTEDVGTWDSSMIGINAKDLADSLCGATASCLEATQDKALFIWSEPDTTSTAGSERSQESYKNAVITEARKKLYDRYGLTYKS